MRTNTLNKKLKTIFLKIVLIFIFTFALVFWAFSWTYSEGTRAGNLIKISKKGIVFKTFEGQLNLGGVNLVEGLEGNIWAFTILDDSLAKTSTSFEGKMVKITYKERYKTLPWLGDTNYIVTTIQKVE